ncbi:Mitochondrial antiviral-signaling protein [Oryzias melastigma]|uniref:Mitochondrial antiviral-signaling protein n=1 Tax=Oryzias melastigma TaxID=30732 RepID=A0A834C8H3_ORYME|nr:Mitochondrial antiviral-signaling protein [Oryzias melastigma]
MSFTSDQLYNTYIRRNLPTIASRVKVREVIVHLPCLTSHDRENIEAKRDTNGNHDAMVLLMECLKRRENWPEQLIQALEACEHTMLASEVRAAYEALTGVNNSSAGSPPGTVVRAHVHPPPAASSPSVPDRGAAVAPPPEVPPVPAEPAIQAPSPLQNTPERPSSEAELSTPTKVPPTVTPPPSPETPHAQQAAAVPREDTRRGPEENSESQFEVGDDANPQNKEEASPQSPGSRNDDSTASPTANQEQLGAREGSGVLTVTPVKRPVQDSSPPAVQTPTARVSEAVQAVDRSPQTEPAASFGPSAGMTPPLDDSCLSKPGQLVSILPQTSPGPAVFPGSLEDPYSGGSDRLEFSEAAPDAVAPSQTPACSSAVSSTAGGSVVDPPCQENGIALDHHEPEESHYESLCPSMEVLENTVHVSQEPSVLNMNGPPPQMKETGKGVTSAAEEAISVSGNSEPPKAKVSPELHPQQKAEPPQAPTSQTAPGGYALAAAGVCACALLVAWKLKKM